MQIALLVIGCWLALDALLLGGWMVAFRVARRHPPARVLPLGDYAPVQPARRKVMSR